MHTLITQAPFGVEQNRWLDVTNEIHHGLRCISSSQLKFLNSGKSPFAFYEKYVLRTVKSTPDENFRIGTLAHLAVLEPDKFEKCVIECELDQRTAAFKEYRENLAKPFEIPLEKKQEILARNALHEIKIKEIDDAIEKLELNLASISDKDLLKAEKLNLKELKKNKKQLEDILEKQKEDDSKFNIRFTKDGGFLNSKGEEIFLVSPIEMEMYRTFQKHVHEHKRVGVMLHESIIEQSGVAQDPETGLWMSLRGDARCQRGYFIDPKTMADELSEDLIYKYCINYHLAIQAAHYIETANLIEGGNKYCVFLFLMMSKNPPYEIALISLDDDAMFYGIKKRREILNKIADCQNHGRWPALDSSHPNSNNGCMSISLPKWGLK